MVREDSADLDSARHVATYCSLVGIQTGLLVQALGYNDVKRMVEIDDEDVQAGENDPLAALLVEGMEELETEGEYPIRPIGSIAALFDKGDL